jgi:hypothetical protein
MARSSTTALKINGLWSSGTPTLVEHVLENDIVLWSVTYYALFDPVWVWGILTSLSISMYSIEFYISASVSFRMRIGLESMENLEQFRKLRCSTQGYPLKGTVYVTNVAYILDFLCHFLAFSFRISAQTLPLFAH